MMGQLCGGRRVELTPRELERGILFLTKTTVLSYVCTKTMKLMKMIKMMKMKKNDENDHYISSNQPTDERKSKIKFEL